MNTCLHPIGSIVQRCAGCHTAEPSGADALNGFLFEGSVQVLLAVSVFQKPVDEISGVARLIVTFFREGRSDLTQFEIGLYACVKRIVSDNENRSVAQGLGVLVDRIDQYEFRHVFFRKVRVSGALTVSLLLHEIVKMCGRSDCLSVRAKQEIDQGA